MRALHRLLRKLARPCGPAAVLLLAAGLAASAEPETSGPRLGGEATVVVADRTAFSRPLPALSSDERVRFQQGQELFRTSWLIAPGPVPTLDGLGPVFNRSSCAGCHQHNGRGQPLPEEARAFRSMLLRLSVAGEDEHGGPKPHPAYGRQLNDWGIIGVPAEGQLAVTYEPVPGRFADNSEYELRRPRFEATNLAFGPLDPEVLTSPRVAPAIVGLGLLEAVPESLILEQADPDDRNGDGISGRANRVWDTALGDVALGRFGWKANAPTLYHQAASAALEDIGITSPLFPEENCTPEQRACRLRASGGSPELSATLLDRLVFFLSALAVPAQRNPDDPAVRTGERLFHELACASCHRPTLKTASHAHVAVLSDQVIHPYTDLLLHDMGEGLADHRPDYAASGGEWRTPPLWGIGLVPEVNRHTFYLHDGRARSLEEAILWHGGEAEAARERYRHLAKEKRAALLAFLASL